MNLLSYFKPQEVDVSYNTKFLASFTQNTNWWQVEDHVPNVSLGSRDHPYNLAPELSTAMQIRKSLWVQRDLFTPLEKQSFWKSENANEKDPQLEYYIPVGSECYDYCPNKSLKFWLGQK